MGRVVVVAMIAVMIAASCGGEVGVEVSVAEPTPGPTEPAVDPTQEPTPEPSATPEATPGLGEGVGDIPAVGTYGSDPYLDGLYDDCAAADMDACDALYADSPFDSEYEAFGGSCGGQFDDIVSQYCGVGPAADVAPELLDIESDEWLAGYTEEVETNFMEACIDNAGESQADFCQCTWNSLATSVPFTDFVLFDRDTTQMTAGIEIALDACGA